MFTIIDKKINFTVPHSAIGSKSNTGRGFASLIPARSQTFLETDHEIFSTAILLLPLIQVGLISFMCTKNWLNA